MKSMKLLLLVLPVASILFAATPAFAREDISVSSLAYDKQEYVPNQPVKLYVTFSAEAKSSNQNQQPPTKVTVIISYKTPNSSWKEVKQTSFDVSWQKSSWSRTTFKAGATKTFESKIPEEETATRGRFRVEFKPSFKYTTRNNKKEGTSFDIEYPDLYVDDVVIGNVSQGTNSYSAEITAKIENVDEDFINSSFTVYFYACLSTLSNTCYQSPLASAGLVNTSIQGSNNQHKEVKVTLQIPSNYVQYVKYIRVLVKEDKIKSSYDSSEDFYEPISFKTTTKLPDLTFVRVQLSSTSNPAIFTSKDTPSRIMEIKNIGTADFSGTFTICFYRSTDSVYGNSDDTLLGQETIQNQAIQTQRTWQQGTTVSLPIPVGTWTIFAKLNCDGSISESNTTNNVIAVTPVVKMVECKSGREQCPSSLGCTKYRECTNYQWGSCKASSNVELCGDGKDNDCDGQTDEDFGNKGKPCYLGTGACEAKGVYTCSSDLKKLECNAIQAKPITEVCDGKDNDCDGEVDEDFDKDNDGSYHATNCSSAYPKAKLDCDDNDKETHPSAKEKCDGKDNNCNGKVDEDFDSDGDGFMDIKYKANCGFYQEFDCDDTNAKIHPSAKEKCDGIDNNCDGTKDAASCSCSNGTTQPCGSKKGECKQGTQTCRNGKWEDCRNEVKATKEECDGKDNDCDGKIDEDFDKDGDQYFDDFHCKKVYPKQQDCNDNDATVHTNAKELCDGKDNNCNGKVDEHVESNGKKVGASCSKPHLTDCTIEGTFQCNQKGVIECIGKLSCREQVQGSEDLQNDASVVDSPLQELEPDFIRDNMNNERVYKEANTNEKKQIGVDFISNDERVGCNCKSNSSAPQSFLWVLFVISFFFRLRKHKKRIP